MVNVRFGNYEQFKEFFSKAPRNVQNILYKAYPEFAQKLTNEYMSAQKKLTEAVKQTQGVVNKATQAIKGNTPKALGTTKEVASTTGKGLGLMSKAKLIPGIVGGAWTMLDPKTTWNQKVLGAMMMVPQTAPYATAGLITTALAPKAIDSYYERKLQDDPAYQNAVNGNLVNLSAPASNIAPQQRNVYSNPMMQLVYNEAVRQGVDPALALALVERESGFNPNARGDSGKSLGLFQIHTPSHPDYTGGFDPQKNAEYGIRFLKNLLNTYGGNVNKALWAYNAGSGNLQKGILPASTKNYISGITNRMGFFGSPQANNYQPTGAMAQTNYTASVPQTRQNAQQPTLNINQDNQYLNQNQQALNPIVEASKLIGEVPDYQTWNLNNQLQLQDLQNNVNQINQPQGVQPMQNQAGNEALLQYLKMQNEKQAQAQQANEALLKQYQEATRADALQNQANQMINSFGALGNQGQPDFTFLSASGQPLTVRFNQTSNIRPLPTNTSSNIDKLLGEMQIRGQAKVGDDVTAQVLQAQALGNLYNQDPLLFLDKDIAQEFMKGQNTLANTSLTGTERRKDIPLNTQAKVIEENTKTAGRLAEAKATAYYNYILEGLKQQNMNTRQAEMLAAQQAMQVYNNEMRAYLQGQELDYKYYALPYNRDTQLMVADAYANRNQPDQELQDQYKRSQIYATGSTFANPQQQQAYWNYVTGGGVNPTNIYGTTPAEDNIFQNIRNRK